MELLAAWLVEYTYSIDTNTNVFPSVHILGCMAAVAAVYTPGLRKPAWRWGVTLCRAYYGVPPCSSSSTR